MGPVSGSINADEIGDMARAIASAVAWIEDLADGGPDVRITAPIKIVEEAAEVAENPDDIEEAADILIVLTALCLGKGWSVADLAAAVAAKVIKNQGRTWEMGANGAWHHVKTTPTDLR